MDTNESNQPAKPANASQPGLHRDQCTAGSTGPTEGRKLASSRKEAYKQGQFPRETPLVGSSLEPSAANQCGSPNEDRQQRRARDTACPPFADMPEDVTDEIVRKVAHRLVRRKKRTRRRRRVKPLLIGLVVLLLLASVVFWGVLSWDSIWEAIAPSVPHNMEPNPFL